jgi:hypothetical protein
LCSDRPVGAIRFEQREVRGVRIARGEGDSICVAMSRQSFAVSRYGHVPIFAPLRRVRLLPRFGTRNDGLSQVGRIDIRLSRLTACARPASVPSTKKWHSKPLQNLPKSARKCHSFMTDQQGRTHGILRLERGLSHSRARQSSRRCGPSGLRLASGYGLG